jgi:Novel STAND NTPase 1
VRLDCTEKDLWEDAVELLRNELQLAEPQEEDTIYPYPGMVSFKIDDARFFYGREDEINDIAMRLRDQRLLWIIGPSGSGKSSLVYAGVLPKLNDPRRFPRGYWLVRAMRPGSHPMAEIARVTGEDPVQVVARVDELLAGSPLARVSCS